MSYNISVIKRFTLLILCLLALSPFLPAQKKKTARDLPPQYRKWLEEEVVYIITNRERDVFLQLDSDRDRNIFIEAFWRQRDPDLNTPENEFKIEHYKRIAYANQWFGRDAPGPGWRTDMGRIHIILGEPRSLDKWESLAEVRPTIVWFYDGMAQYGLPGSFSVVFFKRDEAHPYELYSPVNDGPQNLLTLYTADVAGYEQAYKQLLEIEPRLAEVSLSLIAGETRYSLSPSLSSEVLLKQKIPAAAYENIKDDYAEKLLRYKDIIEVDYTANYIGSEALIKTYQDATGTAFVHYLIEPKRVSFDAFQKRYRAEIQVNGSVTDRQGQTIYQFERKLPLDMDEDQFSRIRSKTFSFQDLFPLAPGQYKMSVLWKNAIGKEFTSLEADLLIPETDAFSLSSPVLAYKTDENSPFKGRNKSFLLDDIQFVPSARDVFMPGETLHFFFQVHGLPAALQSAGFLEYTILKDNAKVLTQTRSFAENTGRTDFAEALPLTGYPSAHYQLKVAILDANKTERLATQVPFDIAPVVALNRPWVLSLPLPASGDPSFAHILGKQYLLKNDLAKAKNLLESAYRSDPNAPEYALDFCRALFAAKDYAGVLGAAEPFLKDERKYDFLQIAGESAHALGRYAEAIAFYKDHLARFGTNILILNAVGECYDRLGNTAEALAAWERSLQLDPNQENIKARVAALKTKK
jgi:GWxTD domain-containing protein